MSITRKQLLAIVLIIVACICSLYYAHNAYAYTEITPPDIGNIEQCENGDDYNNKYLYGTFFRVFIHQNNSLDPYESLGFTVTLNDEVIKEVILDRDGENGYIDEGYNCYFYSTMVTLMTDDTDVTLYFTPFQIVDGERIEGEPQPYAVNMSLIPNKLRVAKDATVEYDINTETLTFSGSGGVDFEYMEYDPCKIIRPYVKHIVFEEGITYFNSTSGSHRFANVVDIQLPDTITRLGECCFSGYTHLKSINLPDSLTSIDNFAFEDCTSLESIAIPDTDIYIGESAFSNCTSLSEITIPGLATLEDGVFEGCSGLRTVNIPSGTQNINSSCFEDCTGLTEINLPDSLRLIGTFAFKGCTGLTDITLPAGLKRIDDRAFDGCSSLSRIIIPKSVTAMSEDICSGCSEDLVFDTPTGSRAYDYAKYNDIPVVHKFGDWTTTQEATDDDAGMKERVCENCGEVEHEIIPKLKPDPAVTPEAMEELQEQLNEAEGKLAAVTQELADAKADLAEAQEKLTDAETGLAQAQTDISAQTTALTEAQTRIAELEAKEQEMEKAILELQTKIKELSEVKPEVKPAAKPVPATVVLKKLKPEKKKIKVIWTVKAGKKSGYQIQYSLKKSFAKSKKVTVASANSTSKTIKKLKTGKKYYVRIRSFITVNGKKTYSTWSKPKYTKVK